MIEKTEVVRIVRELGASSAELDRWIANRWVRPERRRDTLVFAEVDVARARLICEMRHDLDVDEEAIPVVLSLLDQVYRLRADLARLAEAVGAQPEPVRRDILERLKGPR